jgi:uncharacterized lipoprotein YehR (DUF1307 family)
MKNKILYLFISLFSLFLLGGCGSGDSKSSSSAVVQMDLNTTYNAYSGDILNTSEESHITIDYEYGQDFRRITLINGSGTLSQN